jgi:hypothetical protein
VSRTRTTLLKQLLKRKFGEQSDIVKAQNNLEQKPSSPGHLTILSEELAAGNADKDPEILQLAATLLAQIKAHESGHNVQSATGNQIAQAAGGSTASVTIGNAYPREKNEHLKNEP